MAIQIPLMLFTLFICLGSGILFVQSLYVVKGTGRELTKPAVIASFASVVIGGIAVFFHLQHWERIFNGFGHITSGITQELIGIVIVVIVLIMFFLMDRKLGADEKLPVWLGWVGIIVAAAMVLVMSLSYLMPSRPMWDNAMLPLFYEGNMLLFGSLAMAIIAHKKNCDDADVLAVKLVKIGVLLNMVLMAVYALACFIIGGQFNSVGYYLDATKVTTHVTNLTNFGSMAFGGVGAPWLWGGIALGGVVPMVCAFLAGKDVKAEGDAAAKGSAASRMLMLCAVSLGCALVGCFLFRGFIYVLGYSVYVIY